MSIRMLVVGLMLMAALALGLMAVQVARAPQPVVRLSELPPAPLTVSYLTAARALPIGTLLRDEDLSAIAVPPGKLPPQALIDAPQQRAALRGALVRRFVDPGAPILTGDLLRVRERGFLAAVLQPGTRAASIGVDEVSGVAGLIWPGDRVDVILTQAMDPSTPVAQRVVSERILADVRVIAIDQALTRNDTSTAGLTGGHVARTVTLQVSPEDADRLAVAQRLGHISLVVRAMGTDKTDASLPGSVFSRDVSPALDHPIGATVRVIEGDKRNDVTFR
ncbi:Flp pilus assembly protein CpaB [Rhodopila globiformis]|uniref:Flp pilus assembly protein CpaB n=1 Tax=Rhodopila globiformis TaxID=1071 RepID=A0A2S6MW21_RHOGL|nr:Flp pilus assembly protein CpaB [Rhodopila globiformis]PPQ26557.1 Flp pilus assembly protein CpaB [Rhodopila globiformis]